MRLQLLAWIAAALLVQACGSDQCNSDSDCTNGKVCRARRCAEPHIIIGPEYDGGPKPDALILYPDATGFADAVGFADATSTTTPDGGMMDAMTSSTADGGVSDGGGGPDGGGGGAYLEGQVWVRELLLTGGNPAQQTIEGRFFRRTQAPSVSTNGSCHLDSYAASTVTAGIDGQGIDLENVNVAGADMMTPDVTLTNQGTSGVFIPKRIQIMGSFFALGGAPPIRYSTRASTINGQLDSAMTTMAVPPSEFFVQTPPIGAVIGLAQTAITFTWTPHNPTTFPMVLELADANRTVVLTCNFNDSGMFILPDQAKADFLAASPTAPFAIDIGYELTSIWAIPIHGTAETVQATIRHSRFSRFAAIR